MGQQPEPDIAGAHLDWVIGALRQLEPDAVLARKTSLVRCLFFDHQLMPWQITERTGIAESTVRHLCADDERYPAQADANRRRRRIAGHEQLAEAWRRQSG